MSASASSRAKRVLLRAPIPFRRRTLRIAWRARERWRSLRPRGDGEAPSDGLPLPPARLRVLVAGGADSGSFIRSGRMLSEFIAGILERNGHPIRDCDSVLDFGCGCGRVARWWAGLARPRLHGCDYNPELAAWCEANLRFLEVRRNGLEPPLPYPDESFDLVYSLSVFTHLPEPLQLPWIRELERVLRPGGVVLITTSGGRYREKLSAEERSRYDAGALVTHFDEVAGTNMCAAYHPPDYVRGTLLRDLELVDVVPGAEHSPDNALSQDTYLARRPARVR